MKLLFTKTINDANNAGKAFFAGRVYELDDARADQLLKAVPDAVQVVEENSATHEKTSTVQKTDEPKKKTNKKAKKHATPDDELEFIETPIEV